MAFIFPAVPPSSVLDGRLSNPLKRLTTRRKRNQIVGALAMTPPFDALDWRSLSQQALDSGLKNGAAVAGSGSKAEGWEKLSAETRNRHGAHLDLQYGSRDRNRIDFLKSREPNAPTLLFIHGGYWQMRSKSAFTLFAAGPMVHGINVALIGYTLAPDASPD